jgi:hypothetical protein
MLKIPSDEEPKKKKEGVTKREKDKWLVNA